MLVESSRGVPAQMAAAVTAGTPGVYGCGEGSLTIRTSVNIPPIIGKISHGNHRTLEIQRGDALDQSPPVLNFTYKTQVLMDYSTIIGVILQNYEKDSLYVDAHGTCAKDSSDEEPGGLRENWLVLKPELDFDDPCGSFPAQDIL
ncbi:hypothetical protein DUI87_10504 [Hirundo rustica rustica]|uniref:Uncharacterized protein n=1 Tax=Hirundo rustica rustica TaxID=333673 RepID=A0A3M0KIX0_HIRRU|nr:hypothetical protein DUI87_10504 [Hirundo rustica rustica]